MRPSESACSNTAAACVEFRAYESSLLGVREGGGPSVGEGFLHRGDVDVESGSGGGEDDGVRSSGHRASPTQPDGRRPKANAPSSPRTLGLRVSGLASAESRSSSSPWAGTTKDWWNKLQSTAA